MVEISTEGSPASLDEESLKRDYIMFLLHCVWVTNFNIFTPTSDQEVDSEEALREIKAIRNKHFAKACNYAGSFLLGVKDSFFAYFEAEPMAICKLMSRRMDVPLPLILSTIRLCCLGFPPNISPVPKLTQVRSILEHNKKRFLSSSKEDVISRGYIMALQCLVWADNPRYFIDYEHTPQNLSALRSVRNEVLQLGMFFFNQSYKAAENLFVSIAQEAAPHFPKSVFDFMGEILGITSHFVTCTAIIYRNFSLRSSYIPPSRSPT